MVFIDEAPLLLNGYGMSRVAYPIASEGGTAYSLRKYIEYDYERIIPDVKKQASHIAYMRYTTAKTRYYGLSS